MISSNGVRIKVKVISKDPRKKPVLSGRINPKQQALKAAALFLIFALIFIFTGRPLKVFAVPVSTLTVIKNVVGGNALPGAFMVHVESGGADVTGSPRQGSGDGTLYILSAGTYTVSESGGPDGYQQKSISCTNGEVTTTDGTVTLSIGGKATCTIVNQGIPPSLTLKKIVNNDAGGSAASTDWTLSATGNQETPVVLSGNGGASSNGAFLAGTYTLAETPANSDSSITNNYTAGDWSCTGVANDGNKIILGLGQSAVCAITNTYKPNDNDCGDDCGNSSTGTLVVTKIVSGGDATSSDFTIAVNNGESVVASASGTPNGYSFSNLPAGNYTLSESGPSGYIASYSEGCSKGAVAVFAGDPTNCAITNTWYLAISGEETINVAQTSVAIVWTTNHPGSSRVVWGAVSVSDASSTAAGAPNYGYANSTTEDSATTTSHSVTITGLIAGTTYYFRAVSHGSPEVLGPEIFAATPGNSGGGGGLPGGGGTSSGGGGVTITPTGDNFSGGLTFPAGQVAGAFTNTPSGQVLGAATALPRTGIPPAFLFLIFAAVVAAANKKLKLV